MTHRNGRKPPPPPPHTNNGSMCRLGQVIGAGILAYIATFIAAIAVTW